jgi:LPXTG-motif cell wall-anchored protein
MSSTTQDLRTDRPLRAVLLLYFVASLAHFSHNARYLSNYPNLPRWISSGSIYLTWLGLTIVGFSGYLLYRRRQTNIGLAMLGVYASGGIAGLLHYTRAPFTAHSAGMNFTILFESAAAAALIAVSLITAIRRRRLARTS